MKKQFILAMVAVVAVLFAACELNSPSHPSGGGGNGTDTIGLDTLGRDTIGGDTTIIEPEVDDPTPLYPVPAVAPTPGAVTLMIKFDQPVCEDVDLLFVGKYEGCNWTFEDAQQMEWVEDDWYKVVIAPDASGALCGRPIMYDGAVKNWEYTWAYNYDNLVKVWYVQDRMIGYNEYNQLTLYFEQRDAEASKVVYLECRQWKQTPCESPVHEYTVTLYGPEATCGVDFTLEILGSFCNWEENPTPMTHVRDNIWQATVTAHEGDEYKIRGVVNGVGTWDIQVMSWIQVAEEAWDWAWFSNWVFDSTTDVPLYFESEEYYTWSHCVYPIENN